MLKFRFSEKAANFLKKLPLLLKILSNRKIKWEIFFYIFVAFSQYLNFSVVNMKLHHSLERKKRQLSLEKKILMTCHRTLLEDSQVCPKDICCFFSKVGLLDLKAMNSYKLLCWFINLLMKTNDTFL